MRKIFFFLLLSFSPLYSLQMAPWFGDIYRFYWDSNYYFSHFRRVSGLQTRYPSVNHLLKNSLEVSIFPQWNIDTEFELADTPRQSFGFRSFAFQARYLWADDILGDTLSCTSAVSARVSSGKALRDISSPHHGNIETEIILSIGKEHELNSLLLMRVWANGLVGIANRGDPWLGGNGAIAFNYNDRHKCFFLLSGKHGYGRQEVPDPTNFRGYGRVRYRYLDATLSYSLKTDFWGTFSISYIRRIFARSCPGSVNGFSLNYLLAFSF